MRSRLDATDWRILKELQADGRITNVALAARVGLTAPPCLRRVQALEQSGLISGYYAAVDDKMAGFEVTAFAMVRLHAQAEADLRAFEDGLYPYLESSGSILADIVAKKQIDDDIKGRLTQGIKDYKANFLASRKEKEAAAAK